MTVLQMHCDIDSEVYPELHELLASLRSGMSREERLRQLATIGLIWERTRQRAQADLMESAPITVASVGSAALAVTALPRQLPVLTDVVEPADSSGPTPAVTLHAAAADSRVGANDPVHDLPEERQKAHRSRLMRMKEKGLFKNE
jgi:hypothetical protein